MGDVPLFALWVALRAAEFISVIRNLEPTSLAKPANKMNEMEEEDNKYYEKVMDMEVSYLV